MIAWYWLPVAYAAGIATPFLAVGALIGWEWRRADRGL